MRRCHSNPSRKPPWVKRKHSWITTNSPHRRSLSWAESSNGAPFSTGIGARFGRIRLADGLVIAAPASGSGKTLVTLALLRALARKGIAVASAKIGPDYIDPKFHEAATGRPCFNLDAWAMSPSLIASLAAETGSDAEFTLIEGVMGLFDGPESGRGSTADLAEDLALPVILIIDRSHQAQSIAALVAVVSTYR